MRQVMSRGYDLKNGTERLACMQHVWFCAGIGLMFGLSMAVFLWFSLRITLRSFALRPRQRLPGPVVTGTLYKSTFYAPDSDCRPGSIGSRGYYLAVYRYFKGTKESFFTSRVLGTPPQEVDLCVGPVRTEVTGVSAGRFENPRSPFMVPVSEDSIPWKMACLVAAPLMVALLAVCLLRVFAA